jgi:integrase
MRSTGDRNRGARLRCLVVVLWRAGLRIHEALLLTEHDLDERRGSIVVRRGKGGRRREVGMDDHRRRPPMMPASVGLRLLR